MQRFNRSVAIRVALTPRRLMRGSPLTSFNRSVAIRVALTAYAGAGGLDRTLFQSLGCDSGRSDAGRPVVQIVHVEVSIARLRFGSL